MKTHNFRLIFFLLLFDLLCLNYAISTLSISFDEANIYFSKPSFNFDFSFESLSKNLLLSENLLYYLTHFSTFLFGQNDFALRSSTIFLHILSALLIYTLALKYCKSQMDAIFAMILFILLPGSVAAALIITPAPIVIFISLVLLNAYEYRKFALFYVLLIISLFIDKSFNILFLTFFFYAIYTKNRLLLSVSLLLFSLNYAIFGFDVSGRPKGYFLDTLGIFAACFSPLIFVYFFYVIYKFSFKKDKSLLWFLMSVTFIFCILLSFRQKLFLQDFLPFCVICTPLLIKTLMASYRVRLPNFRTNYKIFIQCAGIFLLLFYLLLTFNKLLYFVLDEPKRHFAYDFHFAKDLAKKLKEKNINEIKVDKNLQIRLKFYGINDSSIYYLKSLKSPMNSGENRIKLSFGNFEKNYQILKF